jgi:predicted dehydrogenase
MENASKAAPGRKRARLAIIGLGMIGKVHAQSASEVEECELVAISDADKSKETLYQQYNAVFYSDYRKMIQREEIDGVVIAVPNDAHEPVGSVCAQRGFHLLVEKPITTEIEAAKKLVDSAAKNNVQLLVGHQRRFNPRVEAAREMIRNGELGNLLGVSVLWGLYKPDEYFVDGPWRKEIGGGPILLNLIHEIDTLRYLCGEITSVYADLSHKARNFPVEDTFSLSLRFENGTVGSLLFTDSAPSVWSYDCTSGENPFFFRTNGNCYHFFGTEASLDFPDLKKVYYADKNRKGWQHPLTIQRTGVSNANPYSRQLAHFCRVISGEEKPRTSGSDALRTMTVIDAVFKSGQNGQPVHLEP